MSVRARKYVALGFTVVLAALYGRLSRDWDLGATLAGEGVLISVICLVAMPWIELAPDGGLRRRATD